MMEGEEIDYMRVDRKGGGGKRERERERERDSNASYHAHMYATSGWKKFLVACRRGVCLTGNKISNTLATH
jgi:hypothetical protein